MSTTLFTTDKPTILSRVTNIFKTAKQREEEKNKRDETYAATAEEERKAKQAAHDARNEQYRLGREYRDNGHHREITDTSDTSDIKLEKTKNGHSTNMSPDFDRRLRALQEAQRPYRQHLQPIIVGGKKPKSRKKKPKSHRRKPRTRRKKPKTRRKKH